jgi:pimeloyl-ACP methyl ester carboxylesterase
MDRRWTLNPHTSGFINSYKRYSNENSSRNNNNTIAEAEAETDAGFDSDSNSIRIYYELHGKKDSSSKLILIAGLSSSSRAWTNSLNHLTDHFEICIFDNRGCGDSTQDVTGYGLKDMAGDTWTLLRYLGWDSGECSLCMAGHSMGGKIAQEVIHLAPENTFKNVAIISSGDSLFPTVRTKPGEFIILISPNFEIIYTL